MAVTDSPRLGLTRWSAGTDPLTRLQLDGDHAALDDLAVISLRGTLANRPAAGVVKRIYEVTGDATASNNGRLFWDTGSAWIEVARISDVTAQVDAHADPAQPDRHLSLAQSLRGGAVNMSTGGSVTLSGSYEVSWSQRLIVISAGRGAHFGTDGHFTIAMPASGVVITGAGGAANVTVTAAGVPLSNSWDALYYILPIGGGNASVNANFRVVNYTAAVEIPAHWVLIAIRNGDGSLVRLWDGRTLAPGDTVTATPSASGVANSLMRRNSAGRAQVAAPATAEDIARLDTVTGHENKVAPHSEHPHHLRGTLAARPAAGTPRRIYEVVGDADAANNGRVFWDTGTAWIEIAVLDGAAASRNFISTLNLIAPGAVATMQLHLVDPGLSTERLELKGNPAAASGTFRVFTNNYTNDVELRSRTGLAFAVLGGHTLEAVAPFSRVLDLASIPVGSAAIALAFSHGYSLYVDNVGGGTANNRLWLNAPDRGEIYLGPRAGGTSLHAIHMLADVVNPRADNVTALGGSTRRYTAVWAVNGTIQTSDVRVKEDVQPIPDDTATERVRRVGKEAAISYRWPDGTRRHVGFDAEQVGVIHGETSAAYIDPTYEADARTNPYLGEPTAEWYADRIDPDADADEQDEQRAEAEREWVEAREAFDRETAEIRDAPKGLRPSEMVPDLYAALAKALDRIDQLEERVAALESA